MALKHVFILGAGSSVEAGAPVMKNFFDKTEDLFLHDSIFDDEEKKSVSSIFRLIRKSLSGHANSNIDLNNIETIFGLIEMASIVNELHDYSQNQIRKLKDDLIILIVRTLEETMSIAEGSESSAYSVPEVYRQFANLIQGIGINDCTIITFNYDLIMEAAFATAVKSVNVDYGFPYMQKQTGSKNLRYFKLHGSINWYPKKRGTGLEVIDIKTLHRTREYLTFLNRHIRKGDFDVKAKRLPLTRFRKNLEAFGDFNYLKDYQTTPFIIPPSWNKSAYHSTISDVWQMAVKELSEASHIHIIGYSLPESDMFFKYLFTLSTFAHSRIRSLRVYDPNADVEKNYRRLLGNGLLNRFRFEAVGFSQAVEMIREEAGIRPVANIPSLGMFY